MSFSSIKVTYFQNNILNADETELRFMLLVRVEIVRLSMENNLAICTRSFLGLFFSLFKIYSKNLFSKYNLTKQKTEGFH